MKTEQRLWTEKDGWRLTKEGGLAENAQVVFVFGNRAAMKDKKHLGGIREFYPNARLIGCSTAGEIMGTEVLDYSIVATAVQFEHANLQFAKTKLESMDDSFKAGKRLAESLISDGPVHILALSDGLHVNGSELAKGFCDVIHDETTLTGGLAGDGSDFKETLVLLDDKPEPDAIAAIGFYGDSLKVGYGSMGGWTSFGQDRLVTKSKGNVLYQLDGRSALDLYKEYLGDQARGLPASGLLFPLSLRKEDGKPGLVRTILSVNEKEGSLTFAGDIPEGSYVRLMKANLEGLVEGAAGAAAMSVKTLASPAVDLAVLISCVGRKLVLKQRVEEEVESVRAVLGEGAVLTGFYSYGEICPMNPVERKCLLHNQTMTITTFAEKE